MSPLFVAWVLMLHLHWGVTMFEYNRNKDKSLRQIIFDAIAYVLFLVMVWLM